MLYLCDGHNCKLSSRTVAVAGDCGYHLHSMDLRFCHPATGAEMRLSAPIPAALQTPEEAAARTAAGSL